MKTKIIVENFPGRLESKLNKWLEENYLIEVIDIKYQMTDDLTSAMIIYKQI